MRTVRTPRLHSRKGTALIVAVVAVIIIAATSAAFLWLTVVQHDQAEHKKAMLRALYTAEAGLKEVHLIFNQQRAAEARLLDYFTIQNGEIFNGSFPWGGTCQVVAEEIAGTDDWKLTGTGTVDQAGRGQVSREVQMVLGAVTVPRYLSRWRLAMFADVDLTIGGAFLSDSYDSEIGPYTPVEVEGWVDPFQNDNGDLGSNDRIYMSSSSSEVHGSIKSGPETTGPEITISPQQISGEVGTFPREQPVDPVPFEEWDAARQVNDNDKINAASAAGGSPEPSPDPVIQGPYNPATMALRVGSQEVAILGVPGGPQQTYYFTEVYTQGAGVRIDVVGPSKLYVNGPWTQNGLSKVNHMGEPTDFLVYGIGQNPMTFDGTTNTAVGLYAPAFDLTFNGSPELRGSFIASTIKLNGSGMFHYDEALGRILDHPPEDVVIGYNVDGWYEPSTSVEAGSTLEPVPTEPVDPGGGTLPTQY